MNLNTIVFGADVDDSRSVGRRSSKLQERLKTTVVKVM
jgi:hypothetical protein